MSQSNGIRSEGVVAARISALQPLGPSSPSGGATPRSAPALAAGVRRLRRCHGCLVLGTIWGLASGIRRLWVWAARSVSVSVSVSVHLELFIFLIYCPHEIEYHPYFDEAI